jgi:hypothetical protein
MLFTFLLLTFARAETALPLFRVAQLSAGGALETLDAQALDRLLHRSKPGDPFVIPLPDADARLAFDHASLDPARDLDCCSVTLSGADGEATIALTRSLRVRDFEVRHEGKRYRFRALGHGNFRVER